MLTFVPFKDCIQVLAPERIVGADATIGYILVGYFRPTFRMDYTCEELKQLHLKLREFNKFGVNIPVCENCGGTPAFPKNDPNSPGDECVWGIHVSLDVG